MPAALQSIGDAGLPGQVAARIGNGRGNGQIARMLFRQDIVRQIAPQAFRTKFCLEKFGMMRDQLLNWRADARTALPADG